MVPPHPAAMLAVVAYKADIGRTIAYAILVGLPTAALAGPIFASWIAPRIQLPAENPVAAQFTGGRGGTGGMVPHDTPGFGISLFTVLLPVILMLCASAATSRSTADHAPLRARISSVVRSWRCSWRCCFPFGRLGYRQHFTRDQILKFANDCLAPTRHDSPGDRRRRRVQPGARGSGVGQAIADVALGSHASPLLLAWTVAALIRVATARRRCDDDERWNRRPDCCGYVGERTPSCSCSRRGAGSLVLSHVKTRVLAHQGSSST